jgi:antitoxin HigA-1
MARNNPLMRAIPVSHPGATLREIVLPALGKPKTETARLLGISRQALYDILADSVMQNLNTSERWRLAHCP